MINKKQLISKLRADCGFGLVSIYKRHGKLLDPDGNGGWITEKKRGWQIGINGDICSYVFQSEKKASEFISKHRTLSPILINSGNMRFKPEKLTMGEMIKFGRVDRSPHDSYVWDNKKDDYVRTVAGKVWFCSFEWAVKSANKWNKEQNPKD